MEVILEEIHGHSGILIGGGPSYMVIKNQTSYAIATTDKGMKVVDKNREIFSGRLPSYPTRLSDLVYIDHLDCYLLNSGWKLYRKDIDENPHYAFMNISCGGGLGVNLIYSNLNKRLIIPRYSKGIAVVNLERKQI